MPSLAFAGSQTIASSTASQPMFGTTTTAAASPMYDQFVGNATGANPSVTTLTVTSTAGFNPGQYVLVAISAQLGSATPNLGRVTAVASTTSMTVAGLTQSVASGAYVILAEAAQSVSVWAGANTGVLYIGTAYTVSSTDSSVIASLYATGLFTTQTTDKGHAYSTAGYWIAGTISDTFIASFSQG